MTNISPFVPAGMMRTRVTLQSPTKVAGKQSFGNTGKAWAFVDPTGGLQAATQLEPPYENTYTVQMRYRKGVRVRDRVTFVYEGATQTLEVRSVNDIDQRHITLQLTCKQVTS